MSVCVCVCVCFRKTFMDTINILFFILLKIPIGLTSYQLLESSKTTV